VNENKKTFGKKSEGFLFSLYRHAAI